MIGQRAAVEVPGQRGGSVTICAAISNHGVLHHRVTLGPYNTQHLARFIANPRDILFEQQVQEQQGQELNEDPIPTHVTVWDNVSFQRAAQVHVNKAQELQYHRDKGQVCEMQGDRVVKTTPDSHLICERVTDLHMLCKTIHTLASIIVHTSIFRHTGNEVRSYFSVLAVVLRTDNESPWTDEFDSDLENRAVIREPATLLITNATRSDTAKYRCEVSAADDHKSFDEIVIDLVVRVKPVVPKCSVPKSVPFGKPAELSCVEEEGFPKSQYQWFKNREEIPDDPKTSLKFFNSSYVLNAETGTLKFIAVRKEDAGEYFCRAKNDAGYSECQPQEMEVYDVNLVGILMGVLVVVIVLLCMTVGICCAYKRGYFSSQKQTGNNYKVPAKGDGVDYVRTEDEADRSDPTLIRCCALEASQLYWLYIDIRFSLSRLCKVVKTGKKKSYLRRHETLSICKAEERMNLTLHRKYEPVHRDTVQRPHK
ncbi:hypothetical protein F2P81_009268 [Scophthalmus maximus]|uniref:Ig-like domain-containing protein n=1 Tax=Scophthalmus maximus TaxID=52904 RepID=A0A6A4T6J8_SCOMX|nr:hypothetical protein F2P81_009268 [Scophthalmus maximus]